MSIEHDDYAQRFGLPFLPDGSVTSAKGFRAAGVHAGFREDPGRLDLALVVADEPCACAAVFTRNVFCAAPVQVSRAHLVSGLGAESDPAAIAAGTPAYGTARAIAINSGNANAATGIDGLEAAEAMAGMVAETVGCETAEALVASTGVIGVQLPMGPLEEGLPNAFDELSIDGGHDAAHAIMTTDTHPKECAVSFSGDDLGYPGVTFTVGGMAKGSGMIMPNMATMIAVLTTDAPIAAPQLHEALTEAVGMSFNKVTVDSDTSTNDSCFLFASGAAAAGAAVAEATASDTAATSFAPDTPAMEVFQNALNQVCVSLARAMAADGEGASRLITVSVRGAADEHDAELAARAVANSPLVKTAVAGHDANWGRVAMGLGKSGARFRQQDVSIDLMDNPVMRGGLPVPVDEDEALRRFDDPEIVIEADLGAGSAESTIWTCDLTHDYISINADYRS